jgi:hypothetical protein
MAIIQTTAYMIDHSVELVPKLLDAGPVGNKAKSDLLVESHQTGNLAIAVETFKTNG